MSVPFLHSIGVPINSQNTINKPLVLNEGQMIHGQIKQLFPGQLAEVQIGDQKMVAKLEVPMRAGESYYFQVTSINPEVQLKIISGPTQPQVNEGAQLQNLMQAMQLPKSPDMAALLSFVIENKVPITREGLLQAVQLLQETPAASRQEALLTIQKVLDLKLPLTFSNFNSLFGVETKEGLHSVIDSLREALIKDPAVPEQTRSSIIHQLNLIKQPLESAAGHAVLGQSLQVLLDSEQNAEARFPVLQMLKEANLLPKTASLANLQSVSALMVREAAGVNQASSPMLQVQLASLQKFVSGLTILTADQKNSLSAMMGQATSLRDLNGKWMQQFANVFLRMVGENAAANPINIASNKAVDIQRLLGQEQQAGTPEALKTLLRNAENLDNEAIQNILFAAKSNVADALDGKAARGVLQTLMRSLGMNYEAALSRSDVDYSKLAQTLKPQLLSLISDQALSPAVREMAEQLVARMNGPLLASGENGVNHQLVMQLPLEFMGKRIDATLQWNGRMNDNKQIDADYARILFYLNLHSLRETVIDMQVQNRIVTVTVYNENSGLSAVGQPLQDKLKDGLESIGYKLSGVFFKGFAEEKITHKKLKAADSYEWQGVDFRI